MPFDARGSTWKVDAKACLTGYNATYVQVLLLVAYVVDVLGY